jgi:hypothetical protein
MRRLILSFATVLAIFSATLPVLHAADAQKVAVVHFSKLTPFLGDVAGWEAEKVEGQTVDAAGFKMTTVERDCRKGDSSVHVQLVDYSESGAMLQAITAAAGLLQRDDRGLPQGRGGGWCEGNGRVSECGK